MLLKPPPRYFSKLKLETKSVRAEDLYRISRHSTGEPYFGKTATNRFDDRSKTKRDRFGTCYFGFDLETAIAETILHDEISVNRTFSIANSEIESRYLVKFNKGSLILADLTGLSLKTLGGDGSISTITPPNIPQLWAMAVHRHPQCVDGIYYMSRHLNDRPATVVFERAKANLIGISTEALINVPGIIKAILKLHISFNY